MDLLARLAEKLQYSAHYAKRHISSGVPLGQKDRNIRSGQKVTAQIAVSKHNPGAQSVFGPIDNYTLALTGTTEGNSFTLSGEVTGRQDLTIEIRGTRLADAA
jgi:hypothetical protein